VTALGDTLFPSGTLAQALRDDFSPTAHILIRLRVLHPTIAVAVSLYLILISNWIARQMQNPQVNRLSKLLILFVVIQMSAGVLNVLLLAPIWMQLLHLLLSDALWITLVLLAATALSYSPVEVHVHGLSPRTASPADAGD
jgi:heme A synthase